MKKFTIIVLAVFVVCLAAWGVLRYVRGPWGEHQQDIDHMHRQLDELVNAEQPDGEDEPPEWWSFEPRNNNEQLSFAIDGKQVARREFVLMFEQIALDREHTSHAHGQTAPSFCVDRELRAKKFKPKIDSGLMDVGITFCEPGRKQPAETTRVWCEGVHKPTMKKYRFSSTIVRDPYKEPIVDVEYELENISE